MNGPTKGTDVFVPLDFIIGGQEMAGKGWKMLVTFPGQYLIETPDRLHFPPSA